MVDAHLRPEVIVSATNLKLSTEGTLKLRVVLGGGGGANPEVHFISTVFVMVVKKYFLPSNDKPLVEEVIWESFCSFNTTPLRKGSNKLWRENSIFRSICVVVDVISSAEQING